MARRWPRPSSGRRSQALHLDPLDRSLPRGIAVPNDNDTFPKQSAQSRPCCVGEPSGGVLEIFDRGAVLLSHEGKDHRTLRSTYGRLVTDRRLDMKLLNGARRSINIEMVMAVFVTADCTPVALLSGT